MDDSTTVAEYRYDGLGRRIAKLVPNAGTPANWDRTASHLMLARSSRLAAMARASSAE